MIGLLRANLKPILLTMAILGGLLGAGRLVLAAPKLDGRWRLTITIPEAAGSRNMRDQTVDLNVTPLGDSLVGRLTITDARSQQTVGGVWRQVGKQISITYETPCAVGESSCATLILMGKVKGDLLKKGQVIVLWDTPNDQNVALFDTSNGVFSGFRLE